MKVPPPNEADAVKVLFGIKDRYEKFHAVTYTDDAINFAVSHSNRYIPDRFLTDKAIDLVDEAGARVKLRQTAQPDEITEVGPAFPSPRSKKKRPKNFFVSRRNCTSASFPRISRSARWHVQSAVRARD